MRKFCISLLLFCTLGSAVFANNDNIIKFEGNKYLLQYSTKSEENNGYLNEYFKPGESVNMWSEMLAVHHFPNMYSPISQAESFREYLDEINCPSAIYLDEENNTGMIDFILIDGNKLPIILEFNVFKYEKSPVCGTVAIQYVKRYSVSNSFEIEEVKKEFAKSRKRVLKDLDKVEIPELVTKDIGAKQINQTNKDSKKED